MLRRGAMLATRAAAAGTVAGGSYVTYLFQTDEGTRRALTVYASFLPVVFEYRFATPHCNRWRRHILRRPPPPAPRPTPGRRPLLRTAAQRCVR
jgi:hypothetical protein